MQTKTIDVIVRELLLDLGLPMHFYVKMLYYCLDEYNRISLINGIKSKQVTLSLEGTGVAASVSYASVTYTSSNLGSSGNNVALVFDGTDDIDTVLLAWNTANPTNLITSDAANGAVVPAAGTATLLGGLNPRRAKLPTDYMKFVDLSVQSGERNRTMQRDDTISKKYNESDNDRIAYPDANYSIDTNVISITGNDRDIDYNLLHLGGLYGVSQDSDISFAIDSENSEIVFSNRSSTSDKYVLTYVPTVVSDSIANVLEYPFVDTIKEYAKWKRLESNRAPFNAIESQRRNYINAKKVMKANVHPIRYADVVRSIRRGNHAAPK
jgi:hypothetical protein